MRRTLLSALLLSLLLVMAPAASAQYTGVSSTSTPGLNVRHPLTTDNSILFPPQRDMTLLPGDLLTVSVFGVTPLYTDVERIGVDGTIRLPMAGVVKVANFTVQDAEAVVAKFFETQQIFHDPPVSIQVTEAPNHVATLTGAIRKNVPVVGQRRLLDVLSDAGGLPPTASTIIKIDRAGVMEPIYLDLGNDPATSTAANVPIFTGDIITTGEVGMFYVVGAVSAPGAHPLDGARPTTVLQALASVGGTTEAAKNEDARLIRTIGDTRSVINLHLREIKKGQEPDIALQAEDIILVPSSAFKSIFRAGNAAAVVSMAVALIAILR